MEDNENINKEAAADVSWTFVEKQTTTNESEPNETTEQYVFKSGVQALTDDDLGSSSCDSDGISVISETECFLHDHCTCLPKITSNDDDSDDNRTEEEEQTRLVDTEEEHTRLDDTDERLIETLETNKQVTTNSSNTNVLTFASTVAGVCIVITYLISNYNTTIKNDVTIEDDFDEDMYDMYLWTHYDDNETCDFNKDLFELPAAITTKTKDIKEKTIVNQNDLNKANKGEDISRNSNTVNERKKHKMEKEHLKQHENYLKKKERYLTKREKYLKKLEKHIVNLEAKFRKLFNRMKKDVPPQQQQQINNEYNRKKLKINGTGEWYEKMSYGRSEIRNKEKLSDWIFERSKMRHKLRDKAHWYFNRANGREESRSSEKNIRPGKQRNHFKTYRY